MKKSEIIDFAIDKIKAEIITVSETADGKKCICLDTGLYTVKKINFIFDNDNNIINQCDLLALRDFLNDIFRQPEK